jgi:hypothetical protein
MYLEIAVSVVLKGRSGIEVFRSIEEPHEGDEDEFDS